VDGFLHIAKVRVAGSNPVIRSNRACRARASPRAVPQRSHTLLHQILEERWMGEGPIRWFGCPRTALTWDTRHADKSRALWDTSGECSGPTLSYVPGP